MGCFCVYLLTSACFIQVLQQTLPSQVFSLLIQQMRNYGNKVAEAQQQPTIVAASQQPATISDLSDELE